MLLSSGNASGRIQSFLSGTDYYDDPPQQADMLMAPRRYSSFKFGKDPIVNIHPLDILVMIVSTREVKVHSKGGIKRFNVTQADVLAKEDWPISPSSTPEELKANEYKFTCSTLFRKTSNTLTSYELQNQDSWQWPTHVFIGTSTPFAYCFDLNHGNENVPTMKYNTQVASTCVKENGNFIIFGCSDGKVRMYDGRIRNNKCHQTIEAHSGSVFNMSISLSGLMLVSCGLSAKKVNPFDPNSPAKYHKDPMIRVIDLRVMKSIAAIPIAPQTLPKTIKFMYEYSSCSPPSKMLQFDDDTVYILSTNGIVQTIDVRNTEDVSNNQMFYSLDEEDMQSNSMPANMCISSSTELLVVSTSNGTISQFYRDVDLNIPESSRKCINYTSLGTNLPPAYPKPDKSFGVESEVLAGQYFFNDANAKFPLLSSFFGTPHIMDNKFKLTSTRKISEEIKKDLVYHDYIGTAPNKMGFRPNSMIYGSNAKKAYQVCDPRRIEESNSGDNGDEEGSSIHTFNVPSKHRCLKSPKGGFHSFSFNYTHYNQTPYVSFENNTMNAYVNPILNLLYMIKDVKMTSIQAQTSTYHQTNAFTLWGELGFLFHMMNLMSIEKADIPKVVSANNFQLSLRQIPEALALGLIETTNPQVSSSGGSNSNSNKQEEIDPQLTVQVFMKFLLSQLQREYEKENQFDSSATSSVGGKGGNKSNENLNSLAKAATSSSSSSLSKKGTGGSTIEDIFGYSTIVNTTFLQSNTVENGTPIHSTTLEIIYPTTAPAPRNPKATKKKKLTSFSAILISSFIKETFMRGWCETSKTYEPFKRSRTIFGMAKVRYAFLHVHVILRTFIRICLCTGSHSTVWKYV